MSLTVTLKTATSGLMAAQTGLRAVSDNIANVNTAGYVRKTVEQRPVVVNGTGMGVEVTGITRVTDQYLQLASLTASSDSSRWDVFSQYLDNAQALSESLIRSGLAIVSGGTDSHLMLVDLRPKGEAITGKAVAASLSRAHLTCNYNGVPFDPKPPTVTSGVRVGSPACTTRGLGTAEFAKIGEMIGRVVDGLAKGAANGSGDNAGVEAEVRKEVLDLTARFPIYS